MDPRRLLIPAACGLLLSGCALWRPGLPVERLDFGASGTAVAADDAADTSPAEGMEPRAHDFGPAPAVDPQPDRRSQAAETTTERPYLQPVSAPASPTSPAAQRGREAIAAANRSARAPSTADGFVGGVQVFAWSPGRVFEVWTAPLRVTTLTLGRGETLQSKAAGDTVRWQIGEATSGSGATARTHVMLKPLQRGLETNLILTTNRRVYLIDLKSGSTDAFNTAIAWDEGVSDIFPETGPAIAGADGVRVPDPVVLPEGALDGRYRITPQGRRARWTPTSVFNDGVRTFITFDADLQVDEAPALFVIAPDGEAQLVNYRQVGGLFIVDRMFDRAELRLGDRRPQIVRIQRLTGARS